MVYWIAIVSFCSTCWATLTRRCVGRLLGEEAGEEVLELVVDQLEHAAAGLGVLLDHLHHALDLDFQRAAADGGGVEAHHAGAHAVDQLARRMLAASRRIRARRAPRAAPASAGARTRRGRPAGMRSSARMLWNISATISMVAFSVEVAAFFLSSPVRRRRSPRDLLRRPRRRRRRCPAPSACVGARRHLRLRLRRMLRQRLRQCRRRPGCRPAHRSRPHGRSAGA